MTPDHVVVGSECQIHEVLGLSGDGQGAFPPHVVGHGVLPWPTFVFAKRALEGHVSARRMFAPFRRRFHAERDGGVSLVPP